MKESMVTEIIASIFRIPHPVESRTYMNDDRTAQTRLLLPGTSSAVIMRCADVFLAKRLAEV